MIAKYVTKAAVARVYDPRLSPLIERRYRKSCHYILQSSVDMFNAHANRAVEPS